MALQITGLTRKFKLVKEKSKAPIVLEDPNPNMTPQEVIKFYSNEYPELTNSTIEGPVVVKDTAEYSITVKAGKLG